MELVTREAWGARKPRSTTPLPDTDVRGTAVHYSAAAADQVADHGQCAGRVRSIQNYHMDANDWVDIAYSWLTCQHGSAFQGRGWGIRTAANGTNPSNDHYHACCFLGADKADRDDVQPAGRLAIAGVLAEGRRRYPHAWEVRPHSDFKATACPGNELRAWIGADMPVDQAGERPADMPTDAIVVKSKPVAVVACASGGYWIVTEDGGVFTFAGAPFLGSLGGLSLNAPIVDMIGTPDGQGYWLCAADGGMFNFGNATFFGSLGGVALASAVVDLGVNLAGPGGWMLGGDGGLFALGGAPFGGRIEYRA